jgi:predicted dinucleotide-binding enzyme
MAVSRREASWEADIIIPAVPYAEQAEVASRIKDVVTGKVIISLTVPLNETHRSLVTAPTTSAAEELAQLLPHSKIVKVVSTIFAAQPVKENFGGMNDDVFVAGEDKGSVATVVQLLEDTGIHPLVIGTLARSLTSGEVTPGGEQHAIHY